MHADTSNLAPQPASRRALWLVIALAVCAAVAGVLVVALRQQPAPHQQATSTTKPTKAGKTQIRLALLATGLPHPTDIVATPKAGDHRLFVLDESGVIRIVQPDGTVMDGPFLDISNQVTFSGEMGLLGLAFSPHYATDGLFFINYIDKGQNTVIARYHVSSDANRADPASAQTVLTLKQPYVNHNGGGLRFGSDGYLYAGLGDGGSGGDPENRAQNPGVLFGKLLRLDVAQLPYKIPASNPFANQAGKAGEVWDLGLRNPWRFSFDRQTHELYIADVGQDKFEELNVEPAASKGGVNYGWRCYEGTQAYKPDGCGAASTYAKPVLTYDHQEGRCSITGGYVYRGSKYPTLAGHYFYADYCSGQLFWTSKPAANTAWAGNLALKTPYQITTFGEDNTGELYLADAKSGSLYALEAVN